MEEQVNRLVDKAWAKYQQMPPSQRLLIAISGIPGSGKTTLATHITTHLNALHTSLHPALSPSTSPLAAFVPMDGYHLSHAQLSAFPDPTTAHARRGAAFTFDASSFLALVRALRAPLLPETSTIYAPSFSHAIKDPVADDIAIPACTRIIVFEGNYLSLEREPWKEAAALMDERWFVDVREDVARRRLVERHVRTGVAGSREEAEERVQGNDLLNGREIVRDRGEVDEVVWSREDGGWRAEGLEVEDGAGGEREVSGEGDASV